MKSSVQISRDIESLFGTRDENIRLLESGMNVRTRLLNDSLEIEGDAAAALRGCDRAPGSRVRSRSGGNREDLFGRGDGRFGSTFETRQPYSTHAARGGGRRAARISAGHAAGEGGSVPAAALRRPVRYARRREDRKTTGAEHDR